ncbi:hypothetical protein [Actinoallomurus iriomotensis]|uniref:FAD synthase n=1 Tax=Actinoallomurus iriomotensis TaxID=478107 RepID=A0A9W6S221_9ACTN|nr:hypothetical protein [Actinoallomurus iriomotensis]GLY85664.1 FAD synthase [Actinoallomurus iriomotensis]
MTSRRVATWGTFDGPLHPGHLHFLERCNDYGRLTVFLVHDITVKRLKLHDPIMSHQIRKANILRTNLVHDVVFGAPDPDVDMRSTLRFRPDVYCFGEDQLDAWSVTMRHELNRSGTHLVQIDRYRPDLYSTSALYFR